MDTQSIYHLALVIHIIGLTMMAGTTIADYVVFKQFWKQFALDKAKAGAIQGAVSKYAMLFGIGFTLLVISGITMMGITHGVFGEQIWFRIKFVLILLIVINGLTMGRRNGVKLRKAIAENTTDNTRLMNIRSSLNVFHISQMTLFLIIYTLSVFKFN